MNETEIRSRLRKAMGEYDYRPMSSNEIESRLARGAARPHLGAMGIVATILAILIVVSLVYIRFNSTRTTFPAASPTPSSSIPMSVLERMHIAAASALISEPNLVGTVGDRTVTFVGAYADARNISLIFRVSPASSTQLGIGVWTEFGPVDPSFPLTVGPDGYAWLQNGSVAHNAGEPAHLRVSLWDHWTFPGATAASDARPPAWSFTYNLKVQAATTSLLVQQGVIAVGSWKVTILTFEMTPSTIYLHTVIDGPPPPSGLPGRPSSDNLIAVTSVAMLDKAGTVVSTGGCSSEWALSSSYPRVWELTCEWSRPAQATTYRLVITGGGGQYSTSFNIPAPPTS
jgi:hypothetical protein